MFKEEETQYCPMCEEWAKKYNKLKAENDELKKELDDFQFMYDSLSK